MKQGLVANNSDQRSENGQMSMKRQSLKAALSVGGVVRCAGSVRISAVVLAFSRGKEANSKLGINWSYRNSILI